MQVEREKFVSEDSTGISLQELIEKFNNEHSNFNIQIPNARSKCMLKTIRRTAINEDEVILRSDKTTIMTDKGSMPMEDTIEIECSSRDMMKSVRIKLTEFLDALGISIKDVTTKQTKEEEAIDMIERQNEGR